MRYEVHEVCIPLWKLQWQVPESLRCYWLVFAPFIANLSLWYIHMQAITYVQNVLTSLDSSPWKRLGSNSRRATTSLNGCESVIVRPGGLWHSSSWRRCNSSLTNRYTNMLQYTYSHIHTHTYQRNSWASCWQYPLKEGTWCQIEVSTVWGVTTAHLPDHITLNNRWISWHNEAGNWSDDKDPSTPLAWSVVLSHVLEPPLSPPRWRLLRTLLEGAGGLVVICWMTCIETQRIRSEQTLVMQFRSIYLKAFECCLSVEKHWLRRRVIARWRWLSGLAHLSKGFS